MSHQHAKHSARQRASPAPPAQSELTIPDNGSDVQAQPHDPHLQVACTRQPSEFSVAPMDLDQAWQLLKNGHHNQYQQTLARTLSCQSLVSTEAVLGRSVKRIKSFDHGTQHLIESRRPSEDTRAQANLSQHETHPQTESHLNENAASLEPSDMECSDDEANPQESAADSQASSHSSDLVVRPKNPVTTKNHHQSPKSALPLDDLPTAEQAKSAPLGSKSTSISTSSPATSGDPSDDSAAPRTDKTLELPSDSPAVQHRTSQPPPSTNVPPKQATTDRERVEETLELSSNMSVVQDRTSQPPPSTNVPPKQATTDRERVEETLELSSNVSAVQDHTSQPPPSTNVPPKQATTATDQQISTSPKDLSASLPASRPDVELLKSANIGTSGADLATQRADDTLDLPLNPSGATTVTNAQNASSDETPDLPNSASEATTVSDSSKASSAPLPAPRPDVELSNQPTVAYPVRVPQLRELMRPSTPRRPQQPPILKVLPRHLAHLVLMRPSTCPPTPRGPHQPTRQRPQQPTNPKMLRVPHHKLKGLNCHRRALAPPPTTPLHLKSNLEATDERSTTPASEPPHDIDHNADQEPPPPYEDLPSHSRTPRKAAIDSRKRNSGASAGPSSSKPRKRKKTSKTDENPPEGTDSEAESNFEILEGPINLNP
ncbi:hypothetical protein PGT21_000119 [Puccinia graminis f. sp. tritici]|uniref:Uncharacterized protein n=1 Tax=Puccinia graminis f. sp. tritici TaxID=56615 RepID=A0A5B0LIC0_PUCGR|nr:hypothetical protein PGT21_000119 [Puccinia graminis f. sp. tritici]